MGSLALKGETVSMEVTLAQEMEGALRVMVHLNATATQVGSEMAFSARTWMNAQNKVITVALMQNVLIYLENTNAFANPDGRVMAIIVQISMNANSIGILVVKMKNV